MKKHLPIFILGLILIFSLPSKGQNIGIDTTAFNLSSLPDTINLNDNYNHTITIQNKSAILYTGNIKLYAAIDSAGSIISADSVGVVFVTNFGLNDTVGITYNENYTFLNDYKLGGNIVVVWPVADFGTTTDSLLKNVYIKNPSGISNYHPTSDELIVYPNPVTDRLFIKESDNDLIVKQVRIYNTYGQLLYNENYSNVIDIERFNEGTYIIELEFIDGLKSHYKIIKQ